MAKKTKLETTQRYSVIKKPQDTHSTVTPVTTYALDLDDPPDVIVKFEVTLLLII